MYYAHDSFCNFSEGENKIGILKSQYNIMYLHRKDQLKCISKSNDDIDENEPKLTEEQEQERHSILLKKLENISSINISSPNDTVLKEVLKPTNQNVSKNSYTMNAGKISVENECEEELPLLFED